MKQVLVYRDEGTKLTDVIACRILDHGNKTAVGFVTAYDIKYGALEEGCDLLIVGGGIGTRAYEEKLGPKGAGKIREFVRKGGRYLGICAGACYGMKNTHWGFSTPKEIIDQYSPALVEGVAYGTIKLDVDHGIRDGAMDKSLAIRMYDGTAKSSTVVGLKWSGGKTSKAFYSGGCWFYGPDGAFETLAGYDFGNYEKSAVIRASYGRGTVVLSGPHIELGAEDMAKLSRGLKKTSIEAKRYRMLAKTGFRSILPSLVGAMLRRS
ncbi:MAG: hypothetical protein LBT92_03010 [Rickettsiales bacterium]|jgi:glutamine amidotransferase-like uncharacterized protein|nr:hypothetical protein [Rickettsiales bacterium]